jgi:hypothetical protein
MLWTDYKIFGNSINTHTTSINNLYSGLISLSCLIINYVPLSGGSMTAYLFIFGVNILNYANSLSNSINNLYSGLNSLSGIVYNYNTILGYSININYNTLNYHQNYNISLSSSLLNIYQSLQNQINNINSSTENTYLYNYGISLSSNIYYKSSINNFNTINSYNYLSC